MSLSAPGHCGIPDVPTGNIAAAAADHPLIVHNNVETNHLNLNTPSLTIFNESKNVFSKLTQLSTASAVATTAARSTTIASIGDLSKQSLNEPIKLTLKITLLDSLQVTWESLLINEILYVYISQPPNGNSKEAFIALLEFAEEELHCKKVVVSIDKQNQDLSIMIRLFSFIGFALLPPSHPLILANGSDEMVYLGYDIY